MNNNYNKFNEINHNQINFKEIFNWISILGYYEENKLDDKEINNLLLEKFINTYANLVNKLLQNMITNNIFDSIEPYEVNSQSFIHTDFYKNLIDLFVCLYGEINENLNIYNENLIIVLLNCIYNYFTNNIQQIIQNEKLNSFDFVNKIAIINDFKIIKDFLNNKLKQETQKIKIEQAKINLFINNNIEEITDIISSTIYNNLLDCEGDTNEFEIIIVTLNDYFVDLIKWTEQEILFVLIEKLQNKIMCSNLIKNNQLSRNKLDDYFYKLMQS